jgi:hypothetical protein
MRTSMELVAVEIHVRVSSGVLRVFYRILITK